MLHILRNKLVKELEGYAECELTMESLKCIDTLAHAIKNIDKISEEEYSGRMSRTSYDGSYRSYDGGSYRSYDEGMSARRRDSMGRYASDSGYSGNEEEKLRKIIEQTPDERTRRNLEEFAAEMSRRSR